MLGSRTGASDRNRYQAVATVDADAGLRSDTGPPAVRTVPSTGTWLNLPSPQDQRQSDDRVRVEDGDVDASGARLIVVMGVSGAGKSTLGAALADRMGLPFVDGDGLQPAANVAKMSRGEPLNDEDRRPWLERIRELAVENVRDQAQVRSRTSRLKGKCRWMGMIVACSALKEAYRAVLRGARGEPEPGMQTWFVYLKGEREVLMARMLDRQGHYMKANMLESQLEALESPEGESGVVTVTVEMSTEEQVRNVLEAFELYTI